MVHRLSRAAGQGVAPAGPKQQGSQRLVDAHTTIPATTLPTQQASGGPTQFSDYALDLARKV